MATTFTFQDFIANLEDIGFFEVALPFLLVFTITFAILQKIKIFGAAGKNFNAVVALVMAFLVVRTDTIVEVMNLFLPQISLISIIIVVTLLLVGILLNKPDTGLTGPLGVIGIILTLGGIAFAFLTSSGVLGWELPSTLNVASSDMYILITIVVFLLMIMYLLSDSDPNRENPFWKAMKDFNRGMGGKP